jgi:hypothetical protein
MIWHGACILIRQGVTRANKSPVKRTRFMTRVGTLGHEMRGDVALTQEDETRLPRLLASSVVVLLVMTTCMLHYLPREFAMIVVSWAMLSISVGISFGHCVLNEP